MTKVIKWLFKSNIVATWQTLHSPNLEYSWPLRSCRNWNKFNMNLSHHHLKIKYIFKKWCNSKSTRASTCGNIKSETPSAFTDDTIPVRLLDIAKITNPWFFFFSNLEIQKFLDVWIQIRLIFRHYITIITWKIYRFKGSKESNLSGNFFLVQK